jgi:hypothetical protein
LEIHFRPAVKAPSNLPCWVLRLHFPILSGNAEQCTLSMDQEDG